MRWTTARRSLFTLSLSTALALSWGCQDGIIEIGVVLPLSGDAETYGQAIHRGLLVGYEQLRAEEGLTYQLQLKVVDSQSDPDLARDLLEELYGNNSFVAIGGVTSAEAQKMVKVADDYDRILLSPSASSPELTGISRNFYRVVPSDFGEATKMASFATQTLGIETVVVLAEEQAWARGIQEVFEQEFERHGGEVVEIIEFPARTSDFSGLIERVQTLRPDAVYLTAYDVAVGSLIEALRSRRYPGQILTTHAFATPAAISRVGDQAEGVILTQYLFEIDSEHAHIQRFVRAYREKFGDDPDAYAAQGYDAIRVLAAALEESKPTLPSDLGKGMGSIKDFPGVTGSLQFNDRGDVTKFPRVYIIADDLSMYDYSARVQQEREKLQQRLEELRRQAREIRSSS